MNDALELVGRLEIGTRIRFNRTMIEPACGDHPELLFAREGEMGEITGFGTKEGYWAKTDNHSSKFGVAPHEFDVVLPNAT